MKITKRITAIGAETYSAGGVVQYDLSQAASAAPDRTIGGVVFRARCVRLRIEAALVLTNGSSTATLERNSLLRSIQGVRLWTPERSRIVDCPTIGGRALAYDQLARNGVMDPTVAAVSCTGSGDTSKTLCLEIGFDDRRFGTYADQFRMLAAEFQSATLQVLWPAAGIFGANVSIAATSAIAVYADLEYSRVVSSASRRTLREVAPSASQCALQGLQGLAIMDLLLHPIDATGLTDRVFSTSAISALSLNQDGAPLLNSVPADTITNGFNASNVLDAASALPIASMTLIPTIYQAAEAAPKLSQEPISAAPLDFVQTGSATSSQFKFVGNAIERQNPSDVSAVMRRIGINATKGRPQAGAGLTDTGKLLVPQEVS